MAFADLFLVYPNRNKELRMLAKKAYEFGRNVAAEPTANLSMGILDHTILRQKEYVARTRELVEALAARPIPDAVLTHPVDYDIDLTELYPTYKSALGGGDRPLNEDSQLLMEAWMELAVTVSRSQSASVGGGMINHDKARVVEQLDVLDKYLAEMEKRPILDVPETAEPGAPLET